MGQHTTLSPLEPPRMPSLVRFLVLLGTLAGLVVGGLYAMATLYEPPSTEVVKSVHGVAIRKQ